MKRQSFPVPESYVAGDSWNHKKWAKVKVDIKSLNEIAKKWVKVKINIKSLNEIAKKWLKVQVKVKVNIKSLNEIAKKMSESKTAKWNVEVKK